MSASTGMCLAKSRPTKCKAGMQLLASYTMEVIQSLLSHLRAGHVGAEEEVTRSRSQSDTAAIKMTIFLQPDGRKFHHT